MMFQKNLSIRSLYTGEKVIWFSCKEPLFLDRPQRKCLLGAKTGKKKVLQYPHKMPIFLYPFQQTSERTYTGNVCSCVHVTQLTMLKYVHRQKAWQWALPPQPSFLKSFYSTMNSNTLHVYK
jgi:hypothetical protein